MSYTGDSSPSWIDSGTVKGVGYTGIGLTNKERRRAECALPHPDLYHHKEERRGMSKFKDVKKILNHMEYEIWHCPPPNIDDFAHQICALWEQPKDTKGYHDVMEFYKEKPKCGYCGEGADGPMLVMGAQMAHVACVQTKLAKLIDLDFEQPKAEFPEDGFLDAGVIIWNEDGTSGVATGANKPKNDSLAQPSPLTVYPTVASSGTMPPSVAVEPQSAQEHEQAMLRQVFKDIEREYPAVITHRRSIRPYESLSEWEWSEARLQEEWQNLKQKHLGKEKNSGS